MSAATDPVMDLVDKLPVSGTWPVVDESLGDGPVPFGLRFAASPIRAGKHGKTYYTVTVQEATQVSQDGKVVTVQDSVDRQRED